MLKKNRKSGALRSLILAGVTGACSVGVSQGQIAITQFDLTSDELVISLSGSLNKAAPAGTENQLINIWYGQTGNEEWFKASFISGSIVNNGDDSTVSVGAALLWAGASDGDVGYFRPVSGDWKLGDTLDVTITYNSPGNFDPSMIDPTAIEAFWGYQTGNFRLSSTNVVGGFVAVPEPSIPLLSAISLGLLAFRRTRR